MAYIQSITLYLQGTNKNNKITTGKITENTKSNKIIISEDKIKQ